MAEGGTRAELIELYKISIEEYRFQATLNWNRTQYYLGLNVGMIGIATGILELSSGGVGFLTGGLYLAGAVCSLLSLAAVRVQHDYYRTARNHKARLEAELGLGGLSISTTPGMGSTVARLGKVTTVNSVLLCILAVMNSVGALVVFVGLPT